jgi:hypothetical protein
MPTPIAMRGFDGFCFPDGSFPFPDGGAGGVDSSTVGGGAGVGRASVVNGRRREQ